MHKRHGHAQAARACACELAIQAADGHLLVVAGELLCQLEPLVLPLDDRPLGRNIRGAKLLSYKSPRGTAQSPGLQV